MKVIIAGGRDFKDYDLLKKICNHMLSQSKEVEIVSGCAKGADSLGEQYAIDMGYRCSKFPADWEKYGRAAGFKRNSEMANY